MFGYEIDNLTLTLLLAIVAVLFYERVSKPSPLVHPLLLGRQAEVSPVRQEGESGVYRSFATGHGTPFMVRPANTLKTLHDVVSTVSEPVQRSILDVPLTNDALTELLRLLPLGLRALFPFKAPAHQTTRPILVVLPPNPSTSLPLLLLALASSPESPIIVLPTPQLLIQALEETTAHPAPGIVLAHESIAEGVIEQVAEAMEGKCGVLIAGDTSRRLEPLGRKAAGHGVDVRFWEDLWTAAEDVEGLEIAKSQPKDLHSYFYSSPVGGKSEVVSFTHQNFTAGIAGLLALFTADKRPSLRDTVASAIPLSQPIGLTIALASIWSGAGFQLLGSEEISWQVPDSVEEAELALSSQTGPAPTVIFGTLHHHRTITQHLHQAYRQNSFAQLTVGTKLNSLQEGNISRGGLWDKLAWRGLRSGVLNGVAGDRLRAFVVVNDTPSEAQLGLSNLLFSLPTSRISSTVRSAGPLTVSHFYDLQAQLPDLEKSYASQTGTPTHSGAPANNIELVLRQVIGFDADDTEKRISASPSSTAKDTEAPLKGRLWGRGPAFGGVSVDVIDKDLWVDTGLDGAVATNGTFTFSFHA